MPIIIVVCLSRHACVQPFDVLIVEIIHGGDGFYARIIFQGRKLMENGKAHTVRKHITKSKNFIFTAIQRKTNHKFFPNLFIIDSNT